MRIHKRLIDRLLELAEEVSDCVQFEGTLAGYYACHNLTERIGFGQLDDVLGVSNPTLDDVNIEVQRVYGPSAIAHIYDDGMVGLASSIDKVIFYCPTIESAYAALRTLPDYNAED